ncbi:hypothetical protein BpHYR1_035020 [Brachionus plicatilis]|uniref:Uncharacterized protein n=1 Tax=Brachionus plicatilis TaxID=10195 RepID=A0A3M7SK21_BRAPC|nr:hypothetical protein BpHYR1_035020 [Brachionus plicatilis]
MDAGRTRGLGLGERMPKFLFCGVELSLADGGTLGGINVTFLFIIKIELKKNFKILIEQKLKTIYAFLGLDSYFND